jgi:hypothetical protein
MAEMKKDAAPDPDHVPLDGDAKQLKLDQVKAEARKAIAEAEAATLKAQLPETATKGHEGAVELGEKTGYVAELAAYSLLDHAAARIAKDVPDPLTARILVVEDRNLIASDWQYRLVRDHLDQLADVVGEAVALIDAGVRGAATTPHEAPASDEQDDRKRLLLAPLLAAAPLLTAAPALIGAVSDIVKMFRTDYSVKARDVTIKPAALVSAVVHELLKAGVSTAVDAFTLLDDSQLLVSFEALRRTRLELEKKSIRFNEAVIAPALSALTAITTELADVRAAYDKAVEKGEDSHGLEQRMNGLAIDVQERAAALAPNKAIAGQAKVIADAADAFITSVTAAPKDGYPPIIAAALREPLHGDSVARMTHVLFVEVDSAGGEAVTQKHNFGRSGVVSYVAGAQVSHLLLATGGGLVAGRTQSLLVRLRYDLRSGELEKGWIQNVALG